MAKDKNNSDNDLVMLNILSWDYYVDNFGNARPMFNFKPSIVFLNKLLDYSNKENIYINISDSKYFDGITKAYIKKTNVKKECNHVLTENDIYYYACLPKHIWKSENESMEGGSFKIEEDYDKIYKVDKEKNEKRVKQIIEETEKNISDMIIQENEDKKLMYELISDGKNEASNMVDEEHVIEKYDNNETKETDETKDKKDNKDKKDKDISNYIFSLKPNNIFVISFIVLTLFAFLKK